MEKREAYIIGSFSFIYLILITNEHFFVSTIYVYKIPVKTFWSGKKKDRT